MARNLCEVSIISRNKDPLKVQLLKMLLNNAGVANEKIVEHSDPYSDKLTVYLSSKEKANSLKAFADKIKDCRISSSIKNISDYVWKNSWKESFKSFKLTKKLNVIPVWERLEYKTHNPGNIYIDTSLAFGTGMHETTQFMSLMIERCSGKFDSFLDIGTGTGILAIVANKNGAKTIDVVDISKDALKIAKMNLKNNGVKANNIILGDILKYKLIGKYDLVAANLNTSDLISVSRKLVSFVSPGKFLAVSGISIENEKLFRECFSKFPLRCVKRESGEKWLAFLYKKSLRRS